MVLSVVSQVAQSNRVRGVSLLLHLALDLCIKKHGLVYASIFFNCTALKWRSPGLQNIAPS